VILDQQDIDVFIGLVVGKSGHHAVALNRARKKLFDKALPNDEARLRGILDSLSAHRSSLTRETAAEMIPPGAGVHFNNRLRVQCPAWALIAERMGASQQPFKAQQEWQRKRVRHEDVRLPQIQVVDPCQCLPPRNYEQEEH